MITERNTDNLLLGGFRAYAIGPSAQPVHPGSRRDFYKICVLTGRSIVHYDNRTVELRGTHLIFANPHLPCAARVVSAAQQTGYACLFSEVFLTSHDPSERIRQSPLFAPGHTPLFALAPERVAYVTGIFRRMLEEQHAPYLFRHGLLTSYLQLLVYEGLHLTPAADLFQLQPTGATEAAPGLHLFQRLGPG